MKQGDFQPDDVLDLWFPDTGHQNDLATHGAFWDERMQGGMNERIISQFAELTEAAATGLLDHWSETPRGRLALLIALDQFPRSLWRGTPGAYAQDMKATRLALAGLANGDFDELEPWEQAFYIIAISHCEGPDHLDRMDRLFDVVDGISARMPEALEEMKSGFRAQHETVHGIISNFGRHPHRNEILGRMSTPAEEIYISAGEFPHLPKDRGDR